MMTGHTLKKIAYSQLNSRQQENYNYHKVAGVLADYGFASIRLSDDWEGADFIAVHIDGETVLRVQLKGRMEIAKKYLGRGIHICFRAQGHVYLYPHDDIASVLLATTNIENTNAWKKDNGGYSFSTMTKQLAQAMEPFRLGAEAVPA